MGERNKEFELKFTGSPTEIAALPRSLILSALKHTEGEWERLVTTYFDTPDRAFEKMGASLRLREEGGRFIQAVKCVSNSGANIDRTEYESILASRGDFPQKTGDKTIDAVIRARRSTLAPIAGTISDRWSARAEFRRSKIEIAIDLGRYESWRSTGERVQAPLAELELELKSGRPEDVFDLGRLLARNAAIRFCALSKLETALALGGQGVFVIAKPNNIGAETDEPAIDVLQRALGAVAVRIASLQPALIEARHVESVHQMRVTLRRLRAVERVFRADLASKELEILADKARLFARKLAPARDWDVFLEEALPAALESGYAPGDHNRLIAQAQAARAEGWQDAIEAISNAEFTIFLIDLMEAAVLAKWRDGASKRAASSVREFAPRALNRALKKLLKTARRIDVGNLSELHKLRIALKKLRYPVQLFRTLYPKEPRKEYMAALSALQESFGDVNDAIVAQRLAERAAEGKGDKVMRAAGFVCGYKAASAEAAAKRIREGWPEFAAMAPFWRDN